MRKRVFLVLLCSGIFFTGFSLAATPLPTQQAFNFSLQILNSTTLKAHWQLAPGYYLYRDRITFTLVAPPQVKLLHEPLPAGQEKQDAILGRYQVYLHEFTHLLKLSAPAPTATLSVHFQGCAEFGFCYPPVSKTFELSFKPPFAITEQARVMAWQNTSSTRTPLTEQDKITELLNTRGLGFIIVGFFGFGLLLAFTPCVLPMIPILSSLIVGRLETITTQKAFFLSLIYVLSMAGTYALAGVAAGYAGHSIQALLQNPWIIGIFSGIFILLALSLFGYFELRLPQLWHHHVDKLHQKQKSGTYVGVAVMGCLSTLVVSPCVTPPLVGALSYIGQTGNALLGGIALFFLGLGMGAPLLIIGTTGGRLLPKAGEWMILVKTLFGIWMLGMAVGLLSRILPGDIILSLWAILAVIAAVYLGVFEKVSAQDSFIKIMKKGLALCLFIYGILLIIGSTMGNTDPMHPLKPLRLPERWFTYLNQKPSAVQTKTTITVKTPEALTQQLTIAKAHHQPVLLDFYADWCISCVEMERHVFTDEQVQQALAAVVLIKVDVTANDSASTQLQKSFGVIAPPTLVFLDGQSEEIKSLRMVGETTVQRLLTALQELIRKKA